MRLTKASAKVLKHFLANPNEDQYGFGLMKATGVKSGSLYPILERIQEEGWIERFDEAIDESAEGRPRRRMYRLTSMGLPAARKAVYEFHDDLGPAPSWAPQLQRG
jgi:PadR family transcriptional regulator, regulatory protein PadR